jgi:hypothetical protein
MKIAIAIIASLMSVGIVGIAPAATYHLSPENTSFTGSGTTSATKDGITLKCTAKFTGNVDGTGVGHITGGTFSGALGCSAVTLSNLPWTSPAVGKATVDIQNATFDSPIGDCGPGTVPVTLKKGVISFTNVQLAGSCTISGKITTTPTVSIVK